MNSSGYCFISGVLMTLKQFLSFSKNYIGESGKCEYLQNEKSFLDEIKSIFPLFEELLFCGKKIKNKK